jgi:hypothetical protein
MEDIFEKLPIEIRQKIVPYTYNCQSKILLEDIKNFVKSRETLLTLYYKYWIEYEIGYAEDLADICWLINDLSAYANDYKAIMYGYIDKHYNIFKRNIFLKTESEIDKFIHILEKKSIKTQINVFLGLFTENERNDVILYINGLIKHAEHVLGI